MTIHCHKSSLRSSAAQWNLDALVSLDGQDRIPCFFSVVPNGCTFQTVSSEAGESLLRAVSAALGEPASPPQVVKGGACGGEEEDGEFPFVGAMVSVTWDFPKEQRGGFLLKIQALLGECEGAR